MKNISPKKPPNKKLSSTLIELEAALNQWDEISKDYDSSETKKPGLRDASLISETKKLLAKLKVQIADLDH